MIKKHLLILIFILGYGISLPAMHLQQILGLGISDFGTLRNPSDEDKRDYKEYMAAKAPMVLVADQYDKLRRLSVISACMDVSRLSRHGAELCGRRYTEDELIQDALTQYKTMLFSYVLEFAVIQSAHGTYCGPKPEEFYKIMAKVIANAIHVPLNKVADLQSEVKNEKDDSARYSQWWFEERNKTSDLEADIRKTKNELTKLEAQKKDLDKDNTYKGILLGQAVDAMNGLEKSEADLKAKIAQQEKVALEVAKAAIELEERNEELQEHSARSRREKVELIQDFEKIIKDARDRADQKGALALVAELRKEISPVRRQISPLRRQVIAQEVALAEKDAEIARLRAMLDMQPDKK